MKKIWIVLLIILIVIALWRFNLDELIDSLQQIPLWLILLLVSLQAVTQFLINKQWYQIAKQVGINLSPLTMFYIHCHGTVIDAITPGVKLGGEVMRVVQLKKVTSCTSEQAATVVAIQKLFSMSTMCIIMLFSVGLMITQIPIMQTLPILLLVYGILGFFILLFLSALLFPQRYSAYISKRTKKTPRFVFVNKLRCFLLNDYAVTS